MNQDTISRYQWGGDLYAQLLVQYGQDVADSVANAAATGDQAAVNAAFPGAHSGIVAAPLPTNTLGIFTNQIVTDPLAAPLASANNILGNSFLSLLKNPWVMVTIAAAVFFVVFDGINLIKKKLA
jgi:hypothetical protein